MPVNQKPYEPYIIFDIDGTIADDGHRSIHLLGGKPNWDKYHNGMEHDKLHWHIAQIYFKMCASRHGQNHPAIFITGRPESHRAVTERWLQHYKVIPDYLFMRPTNDFCSSVELKTRIVKEFIQDAPVLFVIEDRAKVVKMWRDLGYNCLQCLEGDY